MKYEIKIKGRKYEVEVKDIAPAIFEVIIDGKKKTWIKVCESKEEEEITAEGEVRAGMAGTIVRILVEEGEKVSKEQPLMVMEAMKMESEIKSPINGVVKKILVKEGEKVNAGSRLALISEE